MRELILGLIRGAKERARRLLGVPFTLLVVGASGVAAAALWLAEHDAHLRQTAELADLQKQTAASVSSLEAQARAAVREANQERARAIEELESRQRKLAQDADDLRQRFRALQSEEQAKLERVATLPEGKLVDEVAARLRLPSGALAQEGLPSGEVRRRETPAPEPDQPIPASGPALQGDTGAGPTRGAPAAGRDTGESSAGILRKVDQTLVELDSCREQGATLGDEVKNANDQLSTDAQTINQQAASIAKLNQALQAKGQALAETQVEHQRELKLARGTRLERLGRVVEHVAIGVVIGALLR